MKRDDPTKGLAFPSTYKNACLAYVFWRVKRTLSPLACMLLIIRMGYDWKAKQWSAASNIDIDAWYRKRDANLLKLGCKPLPYTERIIADFFSMPGKYVVSIYGHILTIENGTIFEGGFHEWILEIPMHWTRPNDIVLSAFTFD